MKLVSFLMLNFATQKKSTNIKKEMNRRNDYSVPRTNVLSVPDESLMALSARPGTHAYDEGLDSEDGWTDDDD